MSGIPTLAATSSNLELRDDGQSPLKVGAKINGGGVPWKLSFEKVVDAGAPSRSTQAQVQAITMS